MDKKEWIDYFETINGRKPSSKEYMDAMKAGEFMADINKQTDLQMNTMSGLQQQQTDLQMNTMSGLQQQQSGFQTNTMSGIQQQQSGFETNIMSGIQQQQSGFQTNTMSGVRQQPNNNQVYSFNTTVQSDVFIHNSSIPKRIRLIGLNGDIRDCSTGFSFKTFFFAWFLSLFRRDWIWLILWSFEVFYFVCALSILIVRGNIAMISISIITSIFASITYNRYYIRKSLKNGYMPLSQADYMGLEMLKRKRKI